MIKAVHQKYVTPAQKTFYKWNGYVCSVLFFVLALGMVLSLWGPIGMGDMDEPARNILGKTGSLMAGALLYRFGILAWLLPLTCLLTIFMILKVKAYNSILILWAGVGWTVICAACLLGGVDSAISLAGRDMPWGGLGGQAVMLTLEAQLGGIVSTLLIVNLCLLGLVGISWGIMPWLWGWRKNPQNRYDKEILNEQELMRQAILQGARDAQKVATIIVDVNSEPVPEGQECQQIYPEDEYQHNGYGQPAEPERAAWSKAGEVADDMVVDIAIENVEVDQDISDQLPAYAGSGYVTRDLSPSGEQIIFAPYEPMEQKVADPACPDISGPPLASAQDMAAEAAAAAPSISEQKPVPGATEDSPYHLPGEPSPELLDEAKSLLARLDISAKEEAAQPAGPIDKSEIDEPEPDREVGESGPLILPRQDEPIIDHGGAMRAASARYQLPPLDLLQTPLTARTQTQSGILNQNSRLLEEKLANFGVQGQVVEVAPGPVVTMYEFKPAPGVKISKVAGLSDDLAMNLKATSVRIVAPIPGKSVIGIEIPSPQREMVFLRELLASDEYINNSSPLTVALGKNILGQPVVSDLSRMPHLLIAGATGAGKSVFINTLVLSILYRATPEQVRLLMVDPKRIELSTYNDIPHLLYPIITQPKDATAGLRWAVTEMERRYDLLAEKGVRNISTYNQRLSAEDMNGGEAPLPYIVIIIDELADLMMVASKEVETLITRLAQMARAAGIHLVLATQRPSVDVITGLIKANFPARLSFQVSSRIDSRTILDTQGAENLLGAGDMLFLPPGTSGLQRLHGAFVSDDEIEEAVNFVKEQGAPQYDDSIVSSGSEEEANGDHDEEDERYMDAVALVKQSGQASISYVQRRLRVGYNRAARMIEQMEREGIVGPSDGSRPREVLIRD